MRLPLNKRCRTCGYRFEADRDACPSDGTSLGRPRPGVEFLGPYRLVERLGAGGMGAIYRAVYEKAGRAVAIKLLHRSMRRETVALSRFFHEARAVNTIRHPNVVELYDLSGDGDDVYMVLELLQGEDLRTLLQDAPGERLVPERAVLLLEQICGALQAAHMNRIIHRDLKPENVFVVRREGQPERVKLLDFGIAKLEQAEGRLTSEGHAMGTPEYMSPEQARGSEVDGRADIYAVGCIGFEMLTGETPFRAANAADVMTRQVREAPRSPRELNPALPEALAAAVLRCLAKSPRSRFQTALDAAQAFSAAMNMKFNSTGAFANWRNWDNLSGSVNVANIPGLTPPGWFARLFARIREAF